MTSCASFLNLGVRHIQVGLLFALLFLANGFRMIMSLGIVAMTDPDTTNAETYDWDESKRSLVLSSFFWGYAAIHIPAGPMARRFGPRKLLLWSFLVCSILTILTFPMATLGSWQLTVVGRLLQGVFQGFIFPCSHTMLSKWAPPAERARLSVLVYSGQNIGMVIMLIVSGPIIVSPLGWPGVFYISGALGLLWVVAWWWYASDSPEVSKRISEEEREFIQSSLGEVSSTEETKKPSIPWKAILTSRPFLAVVIVQCCQNFGFFTLLTQIPSYLAYVMEFDIKQNSLLSALPYFVLFIMCLTCGFVSDLLIKKGIFSVGTSRKTFNSIGHYIPMCALIGLGFISKDNPVGAMALLTIAVGANAGIYVGYLINHIDLSPQYSAVLMGIGNCMGSLNSILGPLLTGWIVTDSSDASLWRIIFFITAAYYLVGNTTFVLLGKGEVQPWNYAPIESNDEDVEKKGEISASTETVLTTSEKDGKF